MIRRILRKKTKKNFNFKKHGLLWNFLLVKIQKFEKPHT